MKLYHAPGSRSARVRWLLLELGIEHEVVTLSATDGSQRTPEYLAINPLGRVPTLEDEGVVFHESGAIVQYVLERYGLPETFPGIQAWLERLSERPAYREAFRGGFGG